MENQNKKILINNVDIINRYTAFDALPDKIKEYSNRVAYNAKQLFAELIKQKIYSDYSDLKKENLNIVCEAVKYFDIGFAFKVENKIDKVLPVYHTSAGSDVFFADVKSREDFKNLSYEEKEIRRLGKDAALYHHEKWNGKGYPIGLKMEEIPLIARICGLCLFFEELTNGNDLNTKDRYAAIKEIEKLSGIEYDPLLVDALINIVSILAVNGENYFMEDEVIIEDEPEIVDEPQEEKKEIVNDNIILEEKKKKKTSRPIEMLFSPIEDVKTNKINYYKSKLVINDRYYGSMMPIIYSNIAEKTGKMLDIILIGMSQVFDFIELCNLSNVELDGVLIKMYPTIIERENNLLKILKAISKANINPEKLIFEIPESTMVNPNEKVQENIKLIKKMNIRIAISDFGIEYSSLSKLGELNFDIMIIGSNFTKNIATNSKTAGVVRGLIDMFKYINVEEVCESVNSVEQLEVLKKLGCRRVEGLLIGEPKPYKEILF